tara:strand:- start:134 stop:460 length:327 start_codon:yes stop_codon:yes gene_type:complete
VELGEQVVVEVEPQLQVRMDQIHLFQQERVVMVEPVRQIQLQDQILRMLAEEALDLTLALQWEPVGQVVVEQVGAHLQVQYPEQLILVVEEVVVDVDQVQLREQVDQV